jgi:hypothetical protein
MRAKSKRTRLYDRLDLLEREFHRRLVPELQQCAAGRNDLLFLAEEYRPESYPRSLTSATTDDLLRKADAIQSLRQKLGEPLEEGLSFKFERACAEWCDVDNSHRLGARNLAKHLLQEIEPAALSEDA